MLNTANGANKKPALLIWIDPLHTQHFQKLALALLTCFSRYGFLTDVPEKDVPIIARLSRHHDIGKLWVPPSILHKSTPLYPEERRVIQTHPLIGVALIIERFPEWSETTEYRYFYEICLHHHERWDGSGYPDGLVGDETPRYVQAIAVADVLDALMAERSYRPAMTSTEAMSMLFNGDCGSFSPELMGILDAELDAIMYEIYPTGHDYARMKGSRVYAGT